MNIGIDGRFYRREAAGLSTYTQNLLPKLLKVSPHDHFYLFLTPKDAKECTIAAKNVTKVVVPIAHYTIDEQTKLHTVLAKYPLDCMHFLNFNHPVRYNGPFIVTIHYLTLLFFSFRR